jgi:hypothetical protein
MSALRPTFTTQAGSPLGPDEVHSLRTVASDTEDVPWMTTSERQWRGTSALYWSLAVYARIHTMPSPGIPTACCP